LNRFVIATSPRDTDTQELLEQVICKQISSLEEGTVSVKDVWVGGIHYPSLDFCGSILGMTPHSLLPDFLAFIGDDIFQRSLLGQRGPTSSYPSRFFKDVGNDFSKIVHPNKRELKCDEEIFTIQKAAEQNKSIRGHKRIAEESAQRMGLKSRLVCFLTPPFLTEGRPSYPLLNISSSW
jgi:hypothetical protein